MGVWAYGRMESARCRFGATTTLVEDHVKLRRVYGCALGMLFVGGANMLAAQHTPSNRARVLGVFDETTGQPLDSVRVLDVLTGTWAMTTKTGTVSLSYLHEGGSLVRLQKVGYEAQTFPVSISAADTAPVTVILRRVTQLAAVVTRADSQPVYLSPALRGFEDRMRLHTAGYFIDEKTLRREDGRDLSNVLVGRVPGVIVNRMHSENFLMGSRRCGSGGPPQVYLDGVPLTPDLSQDGLRIAGLLTARPSNGGTRERTDPELVRNVPFDLSQFHVDNLAGVEWYPDGDMVPIEYDHTSGRCGALFLWTRER